VRCFLAGGKHVKEQLPNGLAPLANIHQSIFHLKKWRCPANPVSLQVRMLLRLRHPCIVQFFGAIVQEDHLAIVTQFVPGGGLFNLLHDHTKRISPQRLLTMTSPMVRWFGRHIDSAGIKYKEASDAGYCFFSSRTRRG
jgi:hypothetical protein